MAARLDALILSDFAQVREGLLFVQSGGLTRIVTASFPARFSCYVAAMVYLPPDEASVAHRMVMKVKAADSASLVATVNVALHDRPDVPGLAPGEGRQVPVVVPLQQVAFPAAGQYDLHVELDDAFAGELSFRVAERSS